VVVHQLAFEPDGVETQIPDVLELVGRVRRVPPQEQGGGWSPGGHGVLTQSITLSEDGNSFDSTIKYEVFDQAGKPTDPASEASAQGARIKP